MKTALVHNHSQVRFSGFHKFHAIMVFPGFKTYYVMTLQQLFYVMTLQQQITFKSSQLPTTSMTKLIFVYF